jgi:uncharacterized protein YjdB
MPRAIRFLPVLALLPSLVAWDCFTKTTTSSMSSSGRPVEYVTVSPASGDIQVGDQTYFRAEGYDAASNRVADATFSWSSSLSSVAAVAAGGGDGSEATVTGCREGTATITAKVSNGPGTPGAATVIVRPGHHHSGPC